MAKKKEEVEGTEEAQKSVAQPKKSIWEQTIEAATDENKEQIIKDMESAIEFLESSDGDPELIAGFKSTLKKMK
jgi:hypothetical protein